MEATATTTTDVRIDLYVRSLRPSGWQRSQTRVIDRLEELAEETTVSDYNIFVWGEFAPPSPADARTGFGQYVLDRITAFKEWANVNGRSMESVFDVRDVHSSITGESHRNLVLPAMVMAEYRDGKLACVTPHESEEGAVSVRDRLTELRVRPDSLADLVSLDDANPGAIDRPVEGVRERERPEDRSRSDGDSSAVPRRNARGSRGGRGLERRQ